jgi:hypothetical protein
MHDASISIYSYFELFVVFTLFNRKSRHVAFLDLQRARFDMLIRFEEFLHFGAYS